MRQADFQATVRNMDDHTLAQTTQETQERLDILTQEQLRRAAETIRNMCEAVKTLGINTGHMNQVLEKLESVTDAESLQRILADIKGQNQDEDQKIYRNPKNPQEIWKGRGRRPLWLQDLIKNGTDIDTLLVCTEANTA